MPAAIFDLSGHTALVTGGNGGLGLAMAKGLVKAGASIAIWGRNGAKNAAAVAELTALGGTVEAFACDVTDPAACATAFVSTIERFGSIHSCFANAGGSGARGPFHTLSTQDWQQSTDLNVSSVVDTFKLAIAHWLERKTPGKLIVTSSVAAVVGLPMATPYCATKAAVEGLVRGLAIEYGRAGIQANAILPGFIETEMSLDTPQYFQDGAKRRAASGEIGRLEDMERGLSGVQRKPVHDRAEFDPRRRPYYFPALIYFPKRFSRSLNVPMTIATVKSSNVWRSRSPRWR
jgi:NAD(P)-dependent dehydrogenase (short-subunit alcohol dehydrogenase family)